MDENVVVTPDDIGDLKPKMKVKGKVFKTSLAGAIVELGIDVYGVIHISRISKEPVARVVDFIEEGQEIEAWVYKVNPDEDRVQLTMIEPVDVEWNEIKPGTEYEGEVVRIEEYGAFVDVGAERPGLVHISEMDYGYVRKPTDVVKEGDTVDVRVINVNRRKKQIKLSMKAMVKPPIEHAKEDAAKHDEPVPTAFEAAFRQAMDKNGENGLE
ncbi:MAG: 30S ribosomal protein S1 [Chloroflexi bacterium]|nr:30S ribosomal protein S1 [Chloroflexota bacterium]